MSDRTDAESQELSDFDVVIVGAGISGALLAKSLGESGKRVLILEAGDEIKPNNNQYLTRYYEATSKGAPESPYTPDTVARLPPSAGSSLVRFTEGQRTDAPLVDPNLVNAGRPTVLSVSLRAWQEPEKHKWIDPKKCDPTSPSNYFDQIGALPFGSTYERIAGGTARHWLGISLRHLPHDFVMGDTYGTFSGQDGKPVPWPNWPRGCRYDDLLPWYGRAEREIGVSGDAATQKAFEQTFGFDGAPTHGYPMPEIPLSHSDKVLSRKLQEQGVKFPVGDGKSVQLTVTPIPAARNSEPFNRRRACAGNASCIPICPIQAKYDPTITLREALNTGKVTLLHRAVACNIATNPLESQGAQGIDHIDFIRYTKDIGGSSVRSKASGRVYVLAGNAIETPRLLLMSNDGKGVTAPERPVGRYLMDHPFYIAAASTDEQVFSYRGPLVTGGIEVLRDGPFRHQHASFRVDVSNSGWSLTRNSTAQTIAEDLILGTNDSGMNAKSDVLAGTALLTRLNQLLTRQVSLGFLIEQTPDEGNRVGLSPDKKDGLGLPRPQITYNFSNYTKDGIVQAMLLARTIFKRVGWKEQEPAEIAGPKPSPDASSFQAEDPTTSPRQTLTLHYMGAGHIAGTCRMGEDPRSSVVDKDLKSWDLGNMYILGSSVFPTLGTANPTLTIAALSLRLAEHLTTYVLTAQEAVAGAAAST